MSKVTRWLDRLWFSQSFRHAASVMRSSVGLVSPVWCVGCGEEDEVLCDECATCVRSQTLKPFRAEATALSLPVVYGVGGEDLAVLPVTAAGRYEDLLAKLIPAYKDYEYVGLEPHLSSALTRSIHESVEQVLQREQGITRLYLITPPVSLGARSKRSFSPLSRLLKSQANARDDFLRCSVATHARSFLPGGKQKARGLSERASKLNGSMVATAQGRKILHGADVLIVDDVLTTGSTLREMYRVLTDSGARVHGGAVLAAVVSRAEPDDAIRFLP